jgi:hypothetical protein
VGSGFAKCRPGFRASDAVDNERVRGLELSESLRCPAPEDTVHRPWVVSQVRHYALKALDRLASCVLPQNRFR